MQLQNIMTNYLNENNINFNVNIISSPIKPKISTWEIETKRMYKSYIFDEKKFLEAFIIQLLKFNRETDANIEFRVKENKVGIIIHSLSSAISEIELEASKDIDKIKKDVMYYYAK